jgi:hypothetical protein
VRFHAACACHHSYICSFYRTPCHEVVRPETCHWLTPTAQPISTSVWGRSVGRLGGTHTLQTLQRLHRSVTSSASTSLQNRWADISVRRHVILQNRIASFWSRGTPNFLSLRGSAVGWGTAHCAASRKIVGSIPDGVFEICHWLSPSGLTMALGSTQHLTEMSIRNLPPSCAYCRRILGASASWSLSKFVKW